MRDEIKLGRLVRVLQASLIKCLKAWHGDMILARLASEQQGLLNAVCSYCRYEDDRIEGFHISFGSLSIGWPRASALARDMYSRGTLWAGDYVCRRRMGSWL
jgi:hypothetical protein